MMKNFIYRLRTQIEDSDYAGVVYHSNYLNYFERARSEWMEQAGFGIKWQLAHNVYFPVVHVDISYIKSARLADNLELHVDNIIVKKVGLTVEQSIYLAGNLEKCLTKATTKLACINDQHKLVKIPDSLSSALI